MRVIAVCRLATPLAVGATLVIASCVSDHVVYEPSRFAAPPTAGGGFVGYADVSSRMTVCGDCHVDQQAAWIQTAHAHAWKDLTASSENSAACVQCHAVSRNGNGNALSAVGYVSSKDPRYQDVQCESCHGAGLTHVTAASIANEPLASVAVDTGAASSGCGACHLTAQDPYVAQWVTSHHALMPTNKAPPFPQTIAKCQACHTGQGALIAFGVVTNYKEINFANGDTLGVTCAVCHDPHSATNAGQLRFPINVASLSGNLCMKCHQEDASLSASTAVHGPMAPEGPMLLGTAGWFPPILTASGPDTIVATHGSKANPLLCVQCHVLNSRKTVDTVGGAAYTTAGHSFNAIPCVNASGVPTGETTCAITSRTFVSCTLSGCHGTQAVAMSAFETGVARIAQLDTTLRAQLATVLAATPAETSSANVVFTTAQGSLFNARLAEKTGSAVHNPLLMEALMVASIEQMTITYGVPAADRVELKPLLGGLRFQSAAPLVRR